MTPTEAERIEFKRGELQAVRDLMCNHDVEAIRAEATAAAEQRLRAKVLALHTAVCACPADGSDPDCHLSVGPVLAILDSPEKTT